MELLVKDVMTTPVIAVHQGTTFQAMAAALREHRVSALPVVDDDGKVVGLVSEADMLAKEALDSTPHGMPGMIGGLLRRQEHQKARGTTAADVMTSPAVMIDPDDTIAWAARVMRVRNVKRLPVVDIKGHLVGIVGRSDLLSVFDRPDEDIRREIVDQVFKQELVADPAAFSITVKDGIVTLEGAADTDDFGHQLVQRVSHVKGVVAMRDHLAYPPSPEPPVDRFDVLARFPAD